MFERIRRLSKNNARSLLSMLLVLALTLSSGMQVLAEVNTANSDPQVEKEKTLLMQVESAVGSTGTDLTIPVTIQGISKGIASYQMEVAYDASVLEVKNVTGLTGGQLTYDASSSNQVVVKWSGGDRIAADQALFTINARIKDDAIAGDTAVELRSIDVQDEQGQKLQTIASAGKVTINSKQTLPTSDKKYEIEGLSDVVLPALQVGYEAANLEAYTYTITNKGTGELTGLAVKLSGKDADRFELIEPQVTVLNAEAPATSFIVKPKIGLAVGKYEARIQLTADHMAELTSQLKLEVVPAVKMRSTAASNLPNNWLSYGVMSGGGASSNPVFAKKTILENDQSRDTNLYVAWSEKNPLGVSQVYVREIDVTQPAIPQSSMSLNQNPDSNAIHPSLAVVDGILYVAWEETSPSGSYIWLKRYVNGNWEIVRGDLPNEAIAEGRTPDLGVRKVYDYADNREKEHVALVWEHANNIFGKEFNDLDGTNFNNGMPLNDLDGNSATPNTEPRIEAGSTEFNSVWVVAWKNGERVGSKKILDSNIYSVTMGEEGINSFGLLHDSSGSYLMMAQQNRIRLFKSSYNYWYDEINDSLSKNSSPVSNPQGLSIGNSGDFFAVWNEEGKVRAKYRKGYRNESWSFVDLNSLSANLVAKPSLISYGNRILMAWENGADQLEVAEFQGFKVQYHAGIDTENKGIGSPPTDEAKYSPGEQATIQYQHGLYRPGYRFKGWQIDGKGQLYNRDDVIEMTNSDINLYPSWTKNLTELIPNDAAGISVTPNQSGDSPMLTDYQDQLYAAWTEYKQVSEYDYINTVYVKRWNELTRTWELVGTEGLNHNVNVDAENVNLIVYKDELYALWEEDHKIRAKKWVNQQWISIEPDPADTINSNELIQVKALQAEVHDGYMYAIWSQDPVRRDDLIDIVVKRYNGVNWVNVDTNAVGIRGDVRAIQPKLFSYQSTTGGYELYAAWTTEERDEDNHLVSSTVVVSKYDETSGKFVVFQQKASNEFTYNFPVIGEFNHKLHVAWVESGLETKNENGEDEWFEYNRIRMEQLEGQQWVDVKGGFAQKKYNYDLRNLKLIEANDNLYLSWTERTNSPDSGFGRIKRYDGDAWIAIDDGGLAWNDGAYAESVKSDLHIFNNKLNVIWSESGPNYGRILVSSVTPQSTPQYKITYSGNDNTSGTVPVDSNKYVVGAEVTLLDNTGDLKKTGFTFAGWNTQADGKGTSYKVGSKLRMAISNLMLYAEWTPNLTPPTPTPTPKPTPDTGSGADTISTTSPKVEIITVDVENGVKNGEVVAKATIKRTTDRNGQKHDEVTFTPEQVKRTIQQLFAAGSKSANIVIPDRKDEVVELNVKLPKQAIEMLVHEGISLEITTPNARIILPLSSMTGLTNDFYFRLVPIKKEEERKQVEQRAKTEEVVREYVGNSTITVLGRPMTIETNLSSRPVTLVLPLPQGVTKQDVTDAGVFIEHSDGDKEVVSGLIVPYDTSGRLGIQITISKFSTFTIIEGIGHVHKPYIYGYPDGTFGPEKSITRAEMAAILDRTFNKPEIAQLPIYPDVNKQHWASSAITRVSAMGLMKGYPDGNFKPEQFITRAEMAVIAAQLGSEVTERIAVASLNDIAGHWALSSIEKVVVQNVMSGYLDKSFKPDQSIIRAEVVTLLNRILHRGPLHGVDKSTFLDVSTSHWAFKQIEEAAVRHKWKQVENQEQFIHE
ncbi:S-layer homology domain-containing protein [Paenibacillus sp. N1-5-1-14]|uniref:S-layer homology domain-containing protein n=1 Tax=Paenibacillus radicibacter TaxID=2972488 RepID=UPI002159B352|nr:S-layer homology domain-containing protein [Paenibacillus radicibacter]MCR8643974.1 S-layer homology domain-containing protein [Paenibacillus radicibacter]